MHQMHQMQSILIQRMRKHYLNMRLHHQIHQQMHQRQSNLEKRMPGNTNGAPRTSNIWIKILFSLTKISLQGMSLNVPLLWVISRCFSMRICLTVLQTNICSTQCNISKGAIGTDKAELERYLGILLCHLSQFLIFGSIESWKLVTN